MSSSILISPAHYRFDRSSGSEYQWSVEIVDHLAKNEGLRVSAITGFQADHLEATVLPVWRELPEMSTFRRLEFIARYTAAGLPRIRRGEVDVLHHFLPFALGATFNPLALLAPSDLPFVLGPVQTQLEFDTSDEVGVAERNFREPGRSRSTIDAALGMGSRAANRLCVATLRRADVIVAISQRAKRACARVVPDSDIAVIPAGVDCTLFRPGPPRGRRYDLLAVCYLVRRKRIDLLLEAVARLARDGLDVSLRVVGDGPERGRLQQMASTLGVTDKVDFSGFMPSTELPDVYRSASILCTTSAAETMGANILEGMASALPLVATRTGIVEDLPEDSFEHIEPNSESIAVKIRALMEDESRRLTLGKRGRELAEREFSWNKIADRYAQVYERAQLLRAQERQDANTVMRTLRRTSWQLARRSDPSTGNPTRGNTT